jgi:PAS domain-containing protein
MLAPEIDFHEIFKISPTAMALFTADLEFVDANEEFLQASGRDLGDLIGHNAFEVFPKMPYEPGNPKWTVQVDGGGARLAARAAARRY